MKTREKRCDKLRRGDEILVASGRLKVTKVQPNPIHEGLLTVHYRVWNDPKATGELMFSPDSVLAVLDNRR